MELVIHPDERLNVICQEVSEPDIDLMNEMARIMIGRNGAGLAATQVGSDKRVIVIHTDDPSNFKAMFNPEIVRTGKDEETMIEGCLSFPGRKKEKTRKVIVTVDYMDETGKEITEVFKRFPARVVQHEIDHLDGILCMED